MQSAKDSAKANERDEGQKTIDRNQSSVNTICVESHSGFRVRTQIIPADTTRRFLQNVEFYPIKDVQTHTKEFSSIHVGVKPSTEWSTVGIVDKCYEKPELLFSVRLTDMRGAYINLYITGKAYATFRTRIKHGTILAVKRPFLLKPNSLHRAIALHADQKQQMCAVGYSMDLKQCAAYNSPKAQCDEFIDGRSGEYCNKHMKRALDFSKGKRAEMMSSTSGFDIRWVSKKRQANGTVVYEATSQAKSPQLPSTAFFAGEKRKEAYFIKGIGYVGTNGSVLDQRQAARKPISETDKAKLEESLKGRMDLGAKNIRRALGLREELQKNVLSNEQRMRIGQQSMHSPEEEEQKKLAIEALTKRRRVGESEPEEEKPRYVYL